MYIYIERERKTEREYCRSVTIHAYNFDQLK